MDKTFQGPRLKIERAKHHINDLKTMISAFNVDSHRVSVHPDGKLGYDVVQVDTAESLPDNFAPIIGDALHNLRSALDLAVNEVVFRRLVQYGTRTVFPFRETRNSLVTAINKALIKQASEDVTDYIVDIVKPYKGGNDALWTLNDLNNIDKHRLLLPVMQLTAINNLIVEDERGEKITIRDWVFVSNRTALHACVGHKNIKITDNGKAGFLVLFANGLPLHGKAVVPSLHQLTEVVSGIVGDIERIFFAETP